jgi:hypothetical protein
MIDVVVGSSAALAGPPAVLLTLIACLILLALRAWAGIQELALTRRVSLYVDVAIGIFFALFVVFVIVRFKSLA